MSGDATCSAAGAAIVRDNHGDFLSPLNRLIALALAYDSTPAALIAQESSVT